MLMTLFKRLFGKKERPPAKPMAEYKTQSLEELQKMVEMDDNVREMLMDKCHAVAFFNYIVDKRQLYLDKVIEEAPSVNETRISSAVMYFWDDLSEEDRESIRKKYTGSLEFVYLMQEHNFISGLSSVTDET